MILYQKPYITIEYDEKLQCLIQYWKGFATSEHFREAIMQSVSYFQEKKIVKLISDTKNFAIVKR